MPVLVIGAGSAGLAVSRGLGVRGIDHVVLERARVGQAWRDRWDSFKLVTPNWTLSLPGSPYGGDDPEGHVARDDIVAYLERYQERCAVPVREGVEVHRLSAGTAKRFCVTTSQGAIDADAVVVCTGTFQRPYHAAAWRFADGVPVLDALAYRNPASIGPGRVLIIGSGETGCQIAEELHFAGREVSLSCGRAPWYPRRLGDLGRRDLAAPCRVPRTETRRHHQPHTPGRQPPVHGRRRRPRPALPDPARARCHTAWPTRADRRQPGLVRR